MASRTVYYLGQAAVCRSTIGHIGGDAVLGIRIPDAVAQILRRMKGKSLMSEADKKAVWNTAITRVEPNKVAVRGYNIAELMGQVSFGSAVYLILTRELPSPAVARLMDAILVSSIDHGATPPSALAARTVAS